MKQGRKVPALLFTRRPLSPPARLFNTSPHNTNLVYLEEVVTAQEEGRILRYLDEAWLKRRRYEKGHWDSAISKYKEAELVGELPSDVASIVARVIRELVLPQYEHRPTAASMLAPHVVDLDADGFISPHVDNVRHSGAVLAGLSLLSSRTLRLHREGGAPDEGLIEQVLRPRSLYLLKGPLRYDYAHSVLAGTQRRLSLIFRDANNEMK